MYIWTFVIFIILAIVYLLFGMVKILKPNQIGIKLWFGKPTDETVGPGGIYFIFWPMQTLRIFTNDIMDFNFVVPSVITRRGQVEGYTNGVVEPAEINIECTLYAQFDKENLVRTVKHTGATNAKGLGPLIVPYVIDTIRTLGSRVPWRLINQERHYAAKWILARLVSGKYKKIDLPSKPKKDKDDDVYGKTNSDEYETDNITLANLENSSPLLQVGLTNVTLAIENIDFTDEDMKKAIFAGEEARLAATATRLTAEAEEYKRIREGAGDAEARKAMLTVVKKAGSDLEALFTLREMAQGTSNTMMYQVPEGLSKIFGTVLGGNSIESMFSRLSTADRNAVLAQIERLTKGE